MTLASSMQEKTHKCKLVVLLPLTGCQVQEGPALVPNSTLVPRLDPHLLQEQVLASSLRENRPGRAWGQLSMLDCFSIGQQTHHVLRLAASTGSGPNSLGFWINKVCPISPLCDLSMCVALGPKSQAPGTAPSYLACEKKPWVFMPGPGQGWECARGVSSLGAL